MPPLRLSRYSENNTHLANSNCGAWYFTNPPSYYVRCEGFSILLRNVHAPRYCRRYERTAVVVPKRVRAGLVKSPPQRRWLLPEGASRLVGTYACGCGAFSAFLGRGSSFLSTALAHNSSAMRDADATAAESADLTRSTCSKKIVSSVGGQKPKNIKLCPQ